MSDQLGSPEGEAIADDLLILFQRNPRPTFEQVRDVCDGGAFMDAAPQLLADPAHGVIELQRAGLTFDLAGLAPGRAVPIPDLGGAGVDDTATQHETRALSLRVGPHIAAGRRTLVVLREWFALAQDLGQRFGAGGVCWVPGGVVIGMESLTRQIDSWGLRGDVPVNLLASFRPTIDGALQSHGLHTFTGQELRIEPPLVQGDGNALARLLFTHLFYAGKQTQSGQLTAPDGHPLRIEPSADGRYVRVTPG
ncbi:hypothetical protein [Citromicrobium bathyomarinum]|uniref:hypothetical protein n=1 Tax=Citromicrobium bathyomarinum TaxID=72174 RepID=UPI00315A6E00